METPHLTICNFTPETIHIQRYEAHASKKKHSKAGTCRSMIENIISHVSGAAYTNLQPISAQDIATTISSFGSTQVDVEMRPDEILRVFLKIDQKLYQANVPSSRSHSQALNPFEESKDPATGYISVYNLQKRHLFLTHRQSYENWMSRIRDDIPISMLSIPGTHNSPTYHHALPSVRCQAASVMDQIRNGVRFLDIRVQPKHPSDPQKSDLVLVHGAFSVSVAHRSLYFRPLVDEILGFLIENPTESIIMSVKREGTGKSTDEQLSKILFDHYVRDKEQWFTAPRVPRLGEARGKIILIRRFGLDQSLRLENKGTGWCIDANAWADNTSNSLCPSGQVCIQDFYQVLETKTIEQKIQYTIDFLKRAAERVFPLSTLSTIDATNDEVDLPFFINFLTASNLWRTGCWPEKIAAKLNPAVLEYLCYEHSKGQEAGASGSGSTGVVVCDFVGFKGDWDLVKCVIAMNARIIKEA